MAHACEKYFEIVLANPKSNAYAVRMKNEYVTVADLIKALSAMPQTAVVKVREEGGAFVAVNKEDVNNYDVFVYIGKDVE